MPTIDPDTLLGARLTDREIAWTERDVILYALGVGVGGDGVDDAALRYLDECRLTALPTFGALLGMLDVDELVALPGTDVCAADLLHAQHEVDLIGAVPVRAAATRGGSVVGIHGRSTGSVVVVETGVRLGAMRFARTRASVFVRGADVACASSGVAPARAAPAPNRPPDVVVTTRTSPAQAALYRLSGDWNRLHLDPELAASAGFERPILHGMCSFGIAVRAVVETVLGGDAGAVRHVRTRFSGIAFPGDTLTTRIWRADGCGAVFETVATNRDDAAVLTSGAVLTTERLEG